MRQAPNIIAWLLIAAVWLCAPFTGDQAPQALNWAHAALTTVAIVVGGVVAARRRAWLLLAAAILTAFAWPM